ncbi:ABC transporter permease [Spongiactinospora sp. 9N601]|uniref:ABC transporter permease n=1 Tax=Spongiactinospora sp. 9N601 TaxID=3375149 RepID=UPI00378F0DE2
MTALTTRLPRMVKPAALHTLLLYVASFAVALTLAGALVTLTGKSMSETAYALYQGSLEGGGSIGLSIDEATPLLLVALGAIVCARAGIFNIGQEGQLLMGAMAGAVVGLFMPGPGWMVMVGSLLGAALGGALWAGIPAVMYYWRGVNVVIGTLLMVFVAAQLAMYVVTQENLLQEDGEAGARSPQSNLLAEGVMLPRVGEYPDLNVTSGVFVVLAVTVAIVLLLRYSTWGFRLRMLGHNPAAARRSGVRATVLGGGALLISGAFAGMAGGIMLSGTVGRFQPGMADNVGWEGLLVALVARNHPVAAIPVALFFGGLRAGGGFLASTGVPRYLVSVVTALLVMAAVFPAAYAELSKLRKRNKPVVVEG